MRLPVLRLDELVVWRDQRGRKFAGRPIFNEHQMTSKNAPKCPGCKKPIYACRCP